MIKGTVDFFASSTPFPASSPGPGHPNLLPPAPALEVGRTGVEVSPPAFTSKEAVSAIKLAISSVENWLSKGEEAPVTWAERCEAAGRCRDLPVK